MSFAKFRHLETLDLSNNYKKVDCSTVAKSWRSLEYTNIITLIRNNFMIDSEQSNHWEQSCFNYLERTKIRSFFLDKNNTATMDRGLHKYLPNLEFQSLTYNRLSSIVNLALDVDMLKNLR